LRARPGRRPRPRPGARAAITTAVVVVPGGGGGSSSGDGVRAVPARPARHSAAHTAVVRVDGAVSQSTAAAAAPLRAVLVVVRARVPIIAALGVAAHAAVCNSLVLDGGRIFHTTPLFVLAAITAEGTTVTLAIERTTTAARFSFKPTAV
jgi:hypothetical protein